MYLTVDAMKRLYASLQDELSRQVFWARLQCDIEPSMTNVLRLDCLRGGLHPEDPITDWIKTFSSVSQNGGRLILYGTGTSGQKMAAYLQTDGIDFFGFVGRGAAAYPDGLLGKPVFSPDWLFRQGDDVYVVIAAASDNYKQIVQLLKEHSFPNERILPYYVSGPSLPKGSRQYFDFPELFPKGTAFIDGGSYDGADSVRFLEFARNQYSKIYVFEPDAANFQRCKQYLESRSLGGLEFYQAGLSDEDGVARFVEKGTSGSFVSGSKLMAYDEKKITEIQTRKSDSVVGDQTVGMIKMDIEGSEYQALHGAERTIRRDQPLLALSVYHRTGDMLAIMQYCQELVPSYGFWLRQYSRLEDDTVLYAAVVPQKAVR